MNRWLLLSLVSLACSCDSLGCAYLVHGTRQEVEIASSPSGAQVLIDDVDMGTTPLSVNLKRDSDHRLRIEMEGYERAEWDITRQWSGWVWGNLVTAVFILPLPIQVFVEYESGGLYSFEVDQLFVRLKNKSRKIQE